LERQVEQAEVLRHLEALPKTQRTRTVVRLRLLGMDFSGIARTVGISIRNARQKWFRILRRLRSVLR